jgi:hypothetical protein
MEKEKRIGDGVNTFSFRKRICAKKTLGGEKRKNENKNQNICFVGNSNRAVLGVLSGFTRDCR